MRQTPRERPKAIALQKLGEHRGNRRLWLEGRKLERAEIMPGDRFTVTWEPESRQVTLSFSPHGDRKVSKRFRNGRDMPIIDVGGADLEDALGPGIERAKVSIFDRRIVVAVHPDDLAAQERIERLVSKVRSGEPVATGSLAHGGGILDHAIHEGMQDAGIKARLAFAVEMDPATLDAAATNNPIWSPDTLMIEASMDEVDFSDIPEIDVLIAGLPCVGASRAGKAKNGIANAEEHETAGHLFVTFLALVKAKQPAIIALENVPEFSSSISATVMRKMLKVMGYDLHETILDGNEMGALEIRKRWCLIAASKDLKLKLEDLRPTRTKEATVSEILDDVPLDSDQWKDIQYMLSKAERDREKGSNFSPNFVSPDADRIRTMGAKYWKWRPTEPKLAHPHEDGKARILTPDEHARAKTVPPELVANLSNTLKHQILGNSVIHAAWQAVGHHMGERMLALASGNEHDVSALVEAAVDLPGVEIDECLGAKPSFAM